MYKIDKKIMFSTFIIIVLLAISFANHPLKQESWGSYSKFYDIVKKNSESRICSIDISNCVDKINSSIYTFRHYWNDYFKDTNIYYMNDKNYAFSNGVRVKYTNNKLYDTKNFLKRNDFPIAKYNFLREGELIFRFPTGVIPLEELNVISKTSNNTYMDYNSNKKIDGGDIQGEFPLIYMDEEDSNNLFYFTTSSLFTNELINMYDNSDFLKETIYFNEDKKTFILMEHYSLAKSYYQEAKYSTENFYLEEVVTISLFAILSLIILFFSPDLKIFFKTYFYSRKKKAIHDFYDLLTNIKLNSKKNPYYNKWLIILNAEKLEKLIINKIGYYQDTTKLKSAVLSRYPEFSAIDLKRILDILYTVKNNDFEIDKLEDAENISKTINYMIRTMKRGF